MSITMDDLMNQIGEIPARKSGSNSKYIFYHCPFHDDHNPSFVTGGNMQPEYGYCFGCSQTYSIWDVAKEKGIDIPARTTFTTPPRPAMSQDDIFIRHSMEVLVGRLDEVNKVWSESKKWSLTEKIVKKYRLGFVDDVTVLPDGFPARTMFANRIIFPVWLPDGELAGFWGRTLVDANVKNIYIPVKKQEKIPYLVSFLKSDKPLLVCEGAADALMVHHFFSNDFSPVGIGGSVANITRETFTDLGLASPIKIILAPDPDHGGIKPVLKHSGQLIESFGLDNLFVQVIPTGMDMDVWLNNEHPDTAAFNAAIVSFKDWVQTISDCQDPVLAAAAADAKKKNLDSQPIPKMDASAMEALLAKVNKIDDDAERMKLLYAMAKQQKKNVKDLISELKKVAEKNFLKNPEQVVFLHPSVDYKNDVAVLGFRGEDIFLGERIEFDLEVVNNNNAITIAEQTSWTVEKKNVMYRFAIEKPKNGLLELGKMWSKADLKLFLERQKPSETPLKIFFGLIAMLKKYTFLEEDYYYKIAAAYIMMSYFYRIFSAVPFLFLYGNKECGKSRLATILQRLCLNACFISRPSEAAIGDYIDGSRGTLIFDQSEFLAFKQFEPMVNFLSGTYTQDTGQRSIVQIGTTNESGNRKIRHFDCFGPKIFASTREPHFDLRDRMLVIPMVKANKKYPSPTSSSEDWKSWRGKLYETFLFYAAEIDRIQATVLWSDNSVGRIAEILTPIKIMLIFCGITLREINEITSLAEKDMKEAAPVIYNFDQMILETLLDTAKASSSVSDDELIGIPVSRLKTEIFTNKNIDVHELTIGEVIRKNRAYLKFRRKDGDMLFMTSVALIRKRLQALQPDTSQQEKQGNEEREKEGFNIKDQKIVPFTSSNDIWSADVLLKQ